MKMARIRIRFASVVVVAIALAMVTVAPLRAGDEHWRHGVGTYQVDNGVAQVTRSVEAWVAPDGRYKAETRHIDKSPAAETVVYDGVQQLVFITDDAGTQKLARGDSSAHFAIGDDVWTQKVTSSSRSVDGVLISIEIDWTDIAPNASLLEMRHITDATIEVDVRPATQEGTATRVPNPNTATFSNCVYAYNYVNSSTGYFRATSSSRGSCYYMDESLWGNSGVAGSGCIWNSYLGSGPTAANFSSKYVYTALSDLCSNHAGWLSDWSLIVAWDGLDAAY